MANQLYYGDNLDVLREHVADESVDLVYLDPPFNSNRNYNVLFREKSGEASPAQIEAFTDTWQWDQNAEAAYHELTTTGSGSVSKMIEAMRQFVGSNDMMAYLVMMAQRIVELHRVLKPTGSLYLHCDPTASHYLKILLDTMFGKEHFRNEIIWQRTSAHSDAHRWGPNSDTILFYSKSPNYEWNPQYQPHSESLQSSHYSKQDGAGRRYTLSDLTAQGTRKGRSGVPWRGLDPNTKGNHWKFTVERLEELDAIGRIYWPAKAGGWPRYIRYFDELKGVPLQAIWTDISPINARAQERLGYPTQKPLALLERIIEASSNPGDVVLDPFCGCGTAVVAAQKLDRNWIGIDITHLAVSLIRTRMVDTFGSEIADEIEVIGDPKDVGAAKALFDQDPYQFEWWALSLVNAMPANDKKKGADRGIDGEIRFHVDNSGKVQRCLVQVKGGHVSSMMMRDLKGTVERENAAMGMLISLQPPSKPMQTEAVTAGYYSAPTGRDFPKIQILTIDELLSGTQPELPSAFATFAKAARHSDTPVTPRMSGID